MSASPPPNSLTPLSSVDEDFLDAANKMQKVKQENEDATDSPVPVTPKSGKKRSKKSLADESPSKKAKGSGKPLSGVKAKLPPLPTCEADMSPADREMVKLKKEGKSWKEIIPSFEQLCGCPVGNSTLPVRYAKVLAAITGFPDEDNERLITAKKEVDLDLEKMRWAAIKKHMEDNGSEVHAVIALQKQWKKLQAQAVEE